MEARLGVDLSLEVAMIVDALLLLQSLLVVVRVADRTVYSPIFWYIALHAYSVTFRLITLNLGFGSDPLIGIHSDDELVRAAIASDLGLMGAVAASMWVAHRAELTPDYLGEVKRPSLKAGLGWVIAIASLAIGTYALIRYSGISAIAESRGIDLASQNTSSLDLASIPRVLAGFAVQGALIVCAIRGFSAKSIGLLVLLIATSSLGLARTFFVLPILLAVLIYLDQHRRDSLSFKWIVAALVLGVVWFAFKPFSHGLQAGESISGAFQDAEDYIAGSRTAGSGDTQFLDMQATFMAAADESGKRFYGSTILPIFYLPVPRFLWPDKPRVNEFAVQLASKSRSFVVEGRTPNLSGEAYLDFGWFGCAIIPLLYILGMQTAYWRLKYREVSSPARWIYLIFLVSMVQVFRDGLVSLVLFPLLNFLPLTGWGIGSMVLSARGPVSEFHGLPRMRQT